MQWRVSPNVSYSSLERTNADELYEDFARCTVLDGVVEGRSIMFVQGLEATSLTTYHPVSVYDSPKDLDFIQAFDPDYGTIICSRYTLVERLFRTIVAPTSVAFAAGVDPP